MSYNGRVNFGLTADYDAMPDLDPLADDLETSIDELAEAAASAAGRLGRGARTQAAIQAPSRAEGLVLSEPPHNACPTSLFAPPGRTTPNAIARHPQPGDRRARWRRSRPAPRGPEVAAEIERARSVLVAERRHEAVGWASVGAYDDAHDYYDGVGEATLYVDRRARRGGTGRALLEALAQEAERRGYYKLVGKIFTTNEPSIALVRSCGWREVGVHRRHGRLDGEWKDVLVVELLLGEALDPRAGRRADSRRADPSARPAAGILAGDEGGRRDHAAGAPLRVRAAADPGIAGLPARRAR